MVWASLAPPASADSLAALVQTCGRVPDDLLEFYRAHDGQLGEATDFVPYHSLLSAKSVAAVWADQQTYESFTWEPTWLPFARFDCDYLCLDAKTGHVLAFFLKFAARPVIAPSFGAFLLQVQRALQTGTFMVTETGLTESPDASVSWIAAWERACLPKKPRRRKRTP